MENKANVTYGYYLRAFGDYGPRNVEATGVLLTYSVRRSRSRIDLQVFFYGLTFY